MNNNEKNGSGNLPTAFPTLASFIDESPTAFHAAENAANLLQEAGYTELSENAPWSLSVGGKYYVRRSQSAIIAFSLPKGEIGGFQIAAAHGDSPALRVKDAISDGKSVRIAVEKYGGMRPEGWFDRPLTVAGRVAVKTGQGAALRLVHAKEPFLVIPSVAPHLAKEFPCQVTCDMLPFMQNGEDKTAFWRKIASLAGCEAGDILSHELYVVPAQAATVWGEGEAFITAPRLDDLQCVYALLAGFLSAMPNPDAVPVFALFDSEEIGSATRQGADSDLLSCVLARIAASTGEGEGAFARLLSGSFLLSADNAHARHPAHPELSDPNTSPCLLNGGIVIKHNAARRYTTDCPAEAAFRLLCEVAGVKTQDYNNRADLPGGSTLGHIAGTHVSVPSIDIGIAQLAMHAAVETAGMQDTVALVKLAARYFSGRIKTENENIRVLLP